MRNMRKTREERKRERSEQSSRAANARWEKEHRESIESGESIIYEQHHAYGAFRITIESERSGSVNMLYLDENGTRRDNFGATLNGKPWKPKVASISDVMKFVRKAIVKTRSGRII